MKNRKGFTLVELIAVIVILGVVILIAATSIGPLITRARKGALGEEGLHMIEAAKYAHKLDEIDEANNIKGSKSICYSLKWLNENDYYDKGKDEGYTGSVLIEYDEETKNYSYKFWLSNGTYVFNNVNEKDYDSELATEGKEAIEDCEGLSKKLPSYTYPDPDPEPEPTPEPEPEEKSLDVCSSPDVIKHDKTIDVNGDGEYDDAGDGGCRYSGNNPNNFICFGKGSENYNNGTSTTCPDENLYRIIGYVPVELSNGNIEYRIKVIKSEYATSEQLGTASMGTSYIKYDSIKRVKKFPTDGFYWHYNAKNDWETSILYQSLNGKYLNSTLGSDAQKIELVKWRVDGHFTTGGTPKNVYDDEKPLELSKAGVPAYVGLMYIHDYSFASSKENWATFISAYNNSLNIENNWLFNSVFEWTITPFSANTWNTFCISYWGEVDVEYGETWWRSYGVRPVFYLKSSVTLSGGDDIDGSDAHPYKVK